MYSGEVLRGSLMALVDELHYKKTHFFGLKGSTTGPLYSAVCRRFRDLANMMHVSRDQDAFTDLLQEFLTLVPADKQETVLDRWERVEDTLNARVRYILGLLGPDETTTLLQRLTGRCEPLPPLSIDFSESLSSLSNGKRSDSRFGQPDVILAHESAWVTMEMKVASGQAKYDADRHFMYLQLADAKQEASHRDNFTSIHMLLAPLSIRSIVKTPAKWLLDNVRDRCCLRVDPHGMLACLSKRLAEANRLGGAPWLARRTDSTPTVVVDLDRFLTEAESRGKGGDAERRELIRQIALVRRHACVRAG